MTQFLYTHIPVIPETKAPAAGEGFSYDMAVYGKDYRRGDYRQGGHVTHPNAALFVIDVDDAAAFLDTNLGRFLSDYGLMQFVTYKSVANDFKFHLYFADPDGQLSPDEFPLQWSSKFCYDVKSNGFVRSEPAYIPVNEPFDIGGQPFSFLETMKDAIEDDKQTHRAATRRMKAEKQGDFLPGSGDLAWDDWHYDGGLPVAMFTCDYEDALRIAGQLRNYYEDYEDAAEEFCTAVYESEDYTGSETWAETFDRLWYSMEPNGGKSIEQRQREETEVLDRIDPDGSGREYAVNKARENYEYNQAYGTQTYQAEPDDEDFEGFSSAYFPAEAPAAHMPEEAQAVARHLVPGTPEYVETQRHFAREKAKELWAENKRQQEEARWTGFSNPFDEDDPPEPSMLKIIGSDLNSHTALIIPNKVTVIYGSRGGGKTWTSAVWAAQELRAGRHVMWLDFERQAQLMKKKLEVLNIRDVTAEKYFHYSGGGLPPVDKLTAHLEDWGGALIVIDSWQDLMGAVAPGSDSNKAEAVNEVYDKFINPLVAAGATIDIIAHPSKTGSAPGSGGSVRGSERAESAADYVIQLDQKVPFTAKQSGYAVLKVTKDRYGVTPNGEVVGALWVGGSDGKIGAGTEMYPKTPEIRCWAPRSEAQEDDQARRQAMSQTLEGRQQDDVIDFLEAQGARGSVVTIGQTSMANMLLGMDKLRPKEDRAWVHKQSPDKPIDVRTVKRRFKELHDAGLIVKGTVVKAGTDLIEWELPKVIEPPKSEPSPVDGVPWETEE